MIAYLAEALFALVILVPAPKNLPDERGYTAQTTDEFQKTFNEMHPKGWRLKRIKGYEKDGASRFDSEWHKPVEPPRFWCHHDITREYYETRTEQLKSEGYTEVLKSTWKIKGEERVWAVWEVK
jgi:hypothetical protein